VFFKHQTELYSQLTTAARSTQTLGANPGESWIHTIMNQSGKPIACDPPNIVTEGQLPDRNLRWSWPRLVAYIIWNGWPFALGSFIVEPVWYFWKNGLMLNGGFILLLLSWLAKALGIGLFFGVFLGCSRLLAQELSGRAKPNSSQRPGA